MPRPTPALLWLRRDLRLTDNPALTAAAKAGPVIAAYIYDPDAPWAPGAASRWWLHHSLVALEKALAVHGVRLVRRRGAMAKTLLGLARETGVNAVYWNALYDPSMADAEPALTAALRASGIEAHVHQGGALLHEPPEQIATKSNTPFFVFTPFWRACLKQDAPAPPLAPPRSLVGAADSPRSETLESWAFLPRKPDWSGGLRAIWSPGEAGATAAARRFVKTGMARYAEARDCPALPGTSRLSPHLHFGEISPRHIWHQTPEPPETSAFLRELGWREFSHHMLHHRPHLTERPMRTAFERFPWREDEAAYRAWTRGRTGYPIVDAGMRELWTTGTMHNRVRMIAASFLVKHLLVPWQHGARWFWDTLVDADLANNTVNWQWVAGCGPDAAPYFRIFNPEVQGQKFDAQGDYVRRWVPELARLPTQYVHAPWRAPALALAGAGISLGATYPSPIVDHASARARALDAFAAIRDRRD